MVSPKEQQNLWARWGVSGSRARSSRSLHSCLPTLFSPKAACVHRARPFELYEFMPRHKSALVVAAAAALLRGADGCTSLEGVDCNGNDIRKIDGPPASMTAAHCCALCAAEAGCKVAVLAPNYEVGKSQCLLKSACPAPAAMRGRVKVCPPGVSCAAPPPTPAPAPAPTPAPAGCDAALAPAAFCDVALSPAARAAALVAELTLQEKVDNVGANAAGAVARLGVPAFQVLTYLLVLSRAST